MRTTPSLMRVLAVGVTLLLAWTGLVAAADAVVSRTIVLRGEQFSPRSVTIKKGDKVRFRWAGGSHNLIGPKARVAPQRTGTKTVTFTARGTYRYKCTLHKDMTTTVKVS